MVYTRLRPNYGLRYKNTQTAKHGKTYIYVSIINNTTVDKENSAKNKIGHISAVNKPRDESVKTFTVFDLISEHTLISEHPPHFVLVKTIARAHRDICVLAVYLCCIMQSIFDAN